MFPNIIKNALETCPASAIWLQLQQVFRTGNGNYPSDFRIKETDGAAKHPAELLNSCADLGGGHGHFLIFQRGRDINHEQNIEPGRFRLVVIRQKEVQVLQPAIGLCAPATSGSRARGSSATSTTTCCRPRSSPHSSASRPCPWRSTRTATSTWKSVCSCWTSSWPPSPAWPRTTSCPMPSSPSQG